MMEIFQHLSRLIAELTFKKMSLVVFFLLVSIACVVGFETYTSWFRLNRLQQAANVLKSVTEIEEMRAQPGANDESIKLLRSQVMKSIEWEPTWIEKGLSFLVPPKDFLKRFFFGGLFVFLMGIVASAKGKETVGAGLFACSGFCGIIGIFLKPIWSYWIHAIVCPMILMAIASLFGIVIEAFSKARSLANKTEGG